jgi:hypothetical protein
LRSRFFVFVSVLLAGALLVGPALVATSADAAGGPALYVGSVRVTEGDAGARTVRVPVTLSYAAPQTVTAKYKVAVHGASVDVRASSGRVTFPRNPSTQRTSTSTFVNVVIAPNPAVKANVTATVTLSTPVGATLGHAVGKVVVLYDHAPPAAARVSVGDVDVYAGEAGPTRTIYVPITLTHAMKKQVTVQYDIGGVTAIQNVDFAAFTGTRLTFSAGQVLRSIPIRIYPNALSGPDEAVAVHLSAPNGATIERPRGVVTIHSDRAPQVVPSTMEGWGYNPNGENAAVLAPEAIGSPAAWASVSAGADHVCATRGDHTLWCWGSGELGNGTFDDAGAPTRIGTRTDWASVSAGDGHTCAIRTDGTLWCWGVNTNGEIGDGTTTLRTTPVQVGATLKPWRSVSTGEDHTCALRSDQDIYCWGNNGAGQVGQNNVGPNHVATVKKPASITGNGGWVSVTAGYRHTCAINRDGTLSCWGASSSGQLGNGGFDGFGIGSPQHAGTAKNWATVSAGSFFTCGIRGDGTLWCWGNNDTGQVGDGTKMRTATPTQIGTPLLWRAVSAGGGHACAVARTGALWCWGDNFAGQVGDGTKDEHDAPFAIGTSNWTAISAGTTQTFGLQS